MKPLKHFLFALTLSASCSTVLAGPYIGADYALIDADIVDLGALAIKGGYQINEWAAVEGRLGTGIRDDGYLGVDVELDNFYGGYFLAGLPNDTMFYPYLIAGYTKMDVKLSGYGMSEDVDDSDFSFGAGARIGLGEVVSGNLEFMRYLDTDGEEIDAISLGLMFKF
jgi:hypothetical protein